jgi:hypothetical protein
MDWEIEKLVYLNITDNQCLPARDWGFANPELRLYNNS